MSSMIETVAIVGDGPAATTLATLLARRGMRVGLFARGNRQAPMIGESTVPALVPILRDLGIEDEVRDYSVFKPGATFTLGSGESLMIDFATVGGKAPGYAYNVPRDRFDATLLDLCIKSGTERFPMSARVEPVESGGDRPRVRLDATAREASSAFFEGAPDFIVDATGRSRLIPNALKLPTQAGDRRDNALFAHCEGVPIDVAGHIHTDRLENGWCWRIPLPDRVSMGLVVDPAVLRGLGDGAEAQFDAMFESDPVLARIAGGARRTTGVTRFNNYQLSTQQGVGDGWALVGDSFGFVDPVFSSGLFLAMDGAAKLAQALEKGDEVSLARYERNHRRHIEAWQQVVRYFYDGRFFAMLRLRDQNHENLIGRVVGPHLSKHLPRVFTGESTAGRYDIRLLEIVMDRGLRVLDDPDWQRWEID